VPLSWILSPDEMGDTPAVGVPALPQPMAGGAPGSR
jgi:hypothetical protein